MDSVRDDEICTEAAHVRRRNIVINSSQDHDELPTEVKRTRCWWPVVETLMVLYVASDFPMMFISDQFQLQKVGIPL